MILNLSEPERVASQGNIQTYLDFIKDNCLPTALPELGRRFREWLKIRRSKGETMRVYYKRYVQHLGKMEQCMQLVQDKDASIRKLNKMIKLRLIMMDKYKARGSGGSITSEATPMPPNPYAKTPSVRSHQSQKSLPKEDKVPRPCESPPPPRRGKWVNGRFVRPQEDEEEEPVQEEYTTPWEEEAADWGDHASEIRRGQKAKEAMDHDPTSFDKKLWRRYRVQLRIRLGAQQRMGMVPKIQMGQ